MSYRTRSRDPLVFAINDTKPFPASEGVNGIMAINLRRKEKNKLKGW